MAHPKEISFSLNCYDQDGDKIETGVFLHFGETRVKVAETVEEFRDIIPHFQVIINEIDATYPNAI